MTNKQFRDYLNEKFPATPGMTSDPGYKKGDRGQFGPKKRAYGDYLWFNDRPIFEESKRMHEAGR